jgi:hypothetical protein
MMKESADAGIIFPEQGISVKSPGLPRYAAIISPALPGPGFRIMLIVSCASVKHFLRIRGQATITITQPGRNRIRRKDKIVAAMDSQL